MARVECKPECKLCGVTLNDSEYCPSCNLTKEEVEQDLSQQ